MLGARRGQPVGRYWIPLNFSEMEDELTTSCLSLHFGLPISNVGKWQLIHLWHVQDFLEKRWQTLDLKPGTSSSPCSFDTSCWASLMVWSVWSIRGLWFSSILGIYKTAVKSSLEKVVMMFFILLLVRGGRVYKYPSCLVSGRKRWLCQYKVRPE